jgi:hypothetical protein
MTVSLCNGVTYKLYNKFFLRYNYFISVIFHPDTLQSIEEVEKKQVSSDMYKATN